MVRGELLAWLQGFDLHCSLLEQFGEKVSKARREQKIRGCTASIAGWKQELKAAKAGSSYFSSCSWTAAAVARRKDQAAGTSAAPAYHWLARRLL